MYINKCSICGNNIKTVYNVKYIGLVGLADEYNEEVGYCDNCEFLFKRNPFTESQLENRYKNLSKYEFKDNNNFVEGKDYIQRSITQKNFINER